MGFTISIKNAPAEAGFWSPSVWYQDNIYYPSTDYLTLSEVGEIPLSAGTGISVDIRAAIFTPGQVLIAYKEQFAVIVKDGQQLVFDWKTGRVNGGPWPLVIGVSLGILALAALVVRASKR